MTQAKYIMEYLRGGRKQHNLYANSLKEAEAKARAIAKRENIGTLLGVKLDARGQ